MGVKKKIKKIKNAAKKIQKVKFDGKKEFCTAERRF